jgi:hypothetical protein
LVKRAALFALICFWCFTAAAQVPAAQAGAGAASARKADAAPAVALPAPDAVLAHYVSALGGEAALKKITSRTLRGTFSVPKQNITGEAQIDMAAPDRFYSLVKISDDVRFIQAFDGKTGWSYDPQRGLRDLGGAELDQMRRSSQFEYELRFREIFPDVRVLDKVTEGDRTAWLVEAKPLAGTAERFYFDTETGLLLRHDSVQAGTDGDIAIVHRYADYVVVDGIKVPTTLHHSDPGLEWDVKFTEIHNNMPVDVSKFAKPVQ